MTHIRRRDSLFNPPLIAGVILTLATIAHAQGIGPPAFGSNTMAQFTPQHVLPGQLVTIVGTNFDGPNLKIWFGSAATGIAALDGDVISVTPTQIKVNVPGAASVLARTSVPITLQTDDGGPVSSDQPLAILAPKPAFGPSPQFTPQHVRTNTGDPVTIVGTSLDGANLELWFGDSFTGIPATASDIVARSATTIVVKAPVVADAMVGTQVPITILTDDGGPVSSVDLLTFVAPAPPPTFSASPQFSPQHQRVGAPITISGSNLAGGDLHVWFGSAAGVPALPTDIVSVSLSQLVVNLPVALAPLVGTSVTITLQTNHGTPVTSTDQLVILPPPADLSVQGSSPDLLTVLANADDLGTVELDAGATSGGADLAPLSTADAAAAPTDLSVATRDLATPDMPTLDHTPLAKHGCAIVGAANGPTNEALSSLFVIAGAVLVSRRRPRPQRL